MNLIKKLKIILILCIRGKLPSQIIVCVFVAVFGIIAQLIITIKKKNNKISKPLEIQPNNEKNNNMFIDRNEEQY